MRYFNGYERPDGSAGIRSYVLTISMVHCANTAAQKIADRTQTRAITHEYGCIEFADHHERTRLALLCAAQHPNVSGVLLVGLGCEQMDHESFMREIRASGREVRYVGIQEEGGMAAAIEKGAAWVRQLQALASRQKRTPCPFSKLTVGVQCGGSDWTTALAGNSVIGELTDALVDSGASVLISEVGGFPGSEHIIAEHACSHQVGIDVLNMCDALREAYLAEHGQPIEAVNPSPGNKAGGITTLVEKSMGNVKKMGRRSKLQGILHAGERVPHPGLWLLDIRAEGPDAISLTGFGMSGAQLTVFSTGRGTPLGSAVMPVLKLTGNPDSYERMRDVFDFNAGSVLQGTPISQCGRALSAKAEEIINGLETQSERNGNNEFLIPRETKHD